MNVSLRLASLFSLGITIASGACGGNVVVDPATSGTGGSTTTNTGLGAGTTSSSSFMDTTASSTTSSGTASTTSSSSGVTTSSSSSSTSSSGSSEACLDDMYFAHNVFWPTAVQCAMQNAGNQAGIQMCLQGQTSLTSGCSACIAADIECSIQSCLGPCSGDPNGNTCAQCRSAACRTAFDACAGTNAEVGSLSCSSLLGDGPTSTNWPRNLVPAYFTTVTVYKTYLGYDDCACNTCGSCNADYCKGKVASATCADCLQQSCGMWTKLCEAN